MSTLNSLMKHLRGDGVGISGSRQKRKLKNVGYYHGCKGYRFAENANSRHNITDIDQIIAFNDFDMQLKTLLYPRIMFIETALKNYTLEAVLHPRHLSIDQKVAIVLTGSQTYHLMQGVSASLAGRIAVLELMQKRLRA